jgi:hypothetical protein
MNPEAPHRRDEIMQALESVERRVGAFFESLTDDEFVLRAGAAWTPAQHLAHLNTSVSAVARGLALPRWLLRLRFGRGRAPSRSYAEMRQHYQVQLARGGAASGKFLPVREEVASGQIGGYRTALLARWARVNTRLRTALADWSEGELDQIRLPHPLLGKLTTREMLFFTLYHNQHHIDSAARRLPRFGASVPA